MQDGIKVQDGKFSKISKHARWKGHAGQTFSFFLSENKGFEPKIPEINKSAGWNKCVQAGLFQKINKDLLHDYLVLQSIDREIMNS